MLNSIRTFFNTHLSRPGGRSPEDAEQVARRAAAALLLEMTHMDDEPQAIERETVMALVRECFGLTYSQAEALLGCADAERNASTDYFQFTSLINEHYSPDEKARLVAALWRVAFADERLGRYEEYLVRKVSDLLHVPHNVFIQAKLQAERAPEPEPEPEKE
ncbi:MAG: TerB family tellurite resistance protein [Thiohalocapsa sp.]|uniref:tellurite resistance TerB family protein n=1 Tax=Thiohalocapsa sp. TaxID=2497641 RepID=UPI0025DCFBB8|nr:TerB family tellurite resistance protein [Thiohalocapsa sp.]MCG6942900.1 TerB family tellurite resistance protein [Thiohalocapsa sp.]